MFTLKTVFNGELPIPDYQNIEVEVWKDNDNNVCAFGHSLNGQYWMHLPHVGSYCFSDDSETITAIIDPNTDPDWVTDSFYRTIVPLALQTRGQEVLHSSAVKLPKGVVALCAVSETGKSTLAYAWSQRGYPQWADDAVAIQLKPETVEVISLPFRMRLRPKSAEHFQRKWEDGYAPSGWRDFTWQPGESVPLLAIFILQREKEAEAPIITTKQLTAGTAFSNVLTHAYCFNLNDPRLKRQMMQTYLSLTARVPVYEVRFKAGLENLDAIIDQMESVVRS